MSWERCKGCVLVHGCGHVCVSRGRFLDVSVCLRSKLTVWKEDQFTVLSGQGKKNRETRVTEWVVKALPLSKSGVWGCVKTRLQWSTEEDTHMRPDHHWLCEFGDACNDTSCEKQFNLDHCKCQDSGSKSGRRMLTHHGHLWLCWSTPTSYVPLFSSSRKCFLQYLRKILAYAREERDCEVLRVFLCVNTCPEISYALSVLSRYLTKDTPQYDIHDKNLLRYVWGRRYAKLTWCTGKVSPPFKTGQFHSFSDSSWDDFLPSRKSTNSYDIFCINTFVS